MLTIEAPVGEVVELDFTLPSSPVTIRAVVRQRLLFATALNSLTQTPGAKSFAAPAATLRFTNP